MVTKCDIFILIFFYISSVFANDGICVRTIREKTKITLSSGKTIEKFDLIPIEECCEGYKNSSNKCEPICEPNCRFGTCVNPQECECFPEYYGESCEKEITDCEYGFWGTYCTEKCDCNGFNCRQMNGKCMCGDGFMGEHCERECGENTYGFNCTNICECVHGVCDKINGSCTCDSEYTGKNCLEKIPMSTTTTKISRYTTSTEITTIRNNNSDEYNIFNDQLISYYFLGLVMLTAIIIVIYFKCIKRKTYGMVNLYAHRIVLPAQNRHSFEDIDFHHYESIHYEPISINISRPDYYRGYEIPCTIAPSHFQHNIKS